MTSFFIYRLPRAKSFIGRSGPVKSGIHTGFLISSFYNHSSALLTIEADKDFSLEDLRKWQKDNASGKEDEGTESVQRLYPLPVRSTSKEDHLENVAAMVSYLCQGEKAICCAAICGNRPIHLADSLISLGTSFPDAMVFCFFTPQSGLWIGASPELLLQKSDDSLFTMALAGTRLADTQKAWDEKNIEEQKMVANYIASLLEKNNLIFDRDEEPSTKKSGSIEHLCTSFHIHAPAKVDSQWLTSFLHDFSPTPALCGFPKEKAYDMIGRIENFSRGYYGGFFGPFSPDGDFSLFVLLRALRVENDKWCMFAGGGITSASEPEKEWIETRNKADSVISKLSFMD